MKELIDKIDSRMQSSLQCSLHPLEHQYLENASIQERNKNNYQITDTISNIDALYIWKFYYKAEKTLLSDPDLLRLFQYRPKYLYLISDTESKPILTSLITKFNLEVVGLGIIRFSKSEPGKVNVDCISNNLTIDSIRISRSDEKKKEDLTHQLL